jgi:hypothetical protein
VEVLLTILTGFVHSFSIIVGNNVVMPAVVDPMHAEVLAALQALHVSMSLITLSTSIDSESACAHF